ncbi:YibE/F family protein [Kineococcus terrestris]|uniref:YibE/F family protein n=1 Tax=Kineococcus terrestris TaxID=2044856 RepID=UPI0034DB428B
MERADDRDASHPGPAHLGPARADDPRPGHAHGGPPPAVPTAPGVRRLLTALVLLALLASGAGIAATWPTAADLPDASVAYTGARTVRAEVVAVRPRECRGELAEERLPDGTLPEVVPCPEADVRVDGGAVTTVTVPQAVFAGGLRAGDGVVLLEFPAAAGQPGTYVWQDVDRRWPLAVVVGVFVLLTVLVGRRRGAAALLGLGLGGAAVVWYVLPALLAGRDPVVVSLSAATAVMGVVLYAAHGVSTRTTAAYLGTLAGLAVTAGFAVLAVGATGLRGLSDEESYTVSVLTGAVDLRGVVLAGTLVAALGLLNDVTITQASAVWELRAADPRAGFRTLLTAGMRVGRDHLASTVYTVAFAYAGAALPSLLLLRLYAQPAGEVLTSSVIAEELVRTAVGGSALAVTVPVTTALAAAAIGGRGGRRREALTPR